MTDKYVICPASGFLHPKALGNIFVRVKVKSRAFTDCSCSGRNFLGHGWQESMGYTFGQARSMGTVQA